MIPQRIDPDASIEEQCLLGARWKIHPDLLAALMLMADILPFTITIISGHRTKERQAELSKEGRPAAPDELSTHRSCPATGADLMPTVAITNAVKASLGAAAVAAGLRWGGGSPVDRSTGIPSDWNHVDLGPRAGRQ